MQFTYPVLLTTADEGGFVVSCRDLPEVVTQGEDLEDAIDNAEGALQAAIEYRIEQDMDIPASSRRKKNEHMATVPILTAMKAALYLATRGKRGMNAKLSLALDLDEKEVRRMLDPHHATKATTIERALAVLGHRLIVSVEKIA
ncbi:MAG: type II toxin-antitoxin system HicB family antitoxin [Candidatus Riflebacteria bacterium]|nr:type II toxin-antitoxin system HicB family antitoxin [Candidatus Riflebacteria bacterium]